MIDQVTVAVNGLSSHANLALSIGPVQCLALAGWHTPTTDLRHTLSQLLPKLRALALIGLPSRTLLQDLPQIDGLGLLPLLDLRSIECGFAAQQLFTLATEGRISPVVLFRRSVITHFPATAYHRRAHGRLHAQDYMAQSSRDELHVIDPFGHWKEHRRWYSDLNGTALAPIVYRSTTR